MRIALAQLNYTVGDFEKNVSLIKQNIIKAKESGVELIVFSELCISAYPPQDFLEFDDFIKKCYTAAEDIAMECKGIAAIVGLPVRNKKIEGKNLFNSALLLTEGRIADEIHKALLPTYDIFDEYRYFEPERNFHCINFKGIKIALTICEDLWNVEDDPMYINSPMDVLIKEEPKLMINIAASPFDHAHAESRKAILKRNAIKYNLPLVYVNHIGAQTEIIFDGGSIGMDAEGNTVHEMNYFREDFAMFDFDAGSKSLTCSKIVPVLNREHIKIADIHEALVLGIRDYFSKQNFKKAILGLSGGIDSALVTVLAATALGPENVHTILMPSEFSSKGSVDDSLALLQNTSVSHDVIPIKDLLDQYLISLKPFFKDLPFSVAEENIQARIRGGLLMAESNKFGYILLNTSNKSELAVGYGTLYGDMCGGLSVIGDIYKTQVFELCRYINRNGEIIPENILTKPPSAELRPNQKDSDSLPEYDILDKVLIEYIENRRGPSELMAMGFDESLIRRILKMVNTNEYKRYQTPPILRVSPKAFGKGRRLPIVGKYLS
ncbi:MAG: NAD+ synthase [Bacteroidetes bacterium]|nr:NAD+ synthase [Bacteroidota bacterium]